MALSPDGSRLFALLEKPLFISAGQPEGISCGSWNSTPPAAPGPAGP
ncbi:hypothetical protein ACFQU2_13580 [Siccirubricoccus deserti]